MTRILPLTEHEVTVLKAMYASEYHDGGARPWVWTFSVAEGAGFANRRTLSGTVASLVKKGLIAADGAGDEASLVMTSLGVDICTRGGIYTPPVAAEPAKRPYQADITDADGECHSYYFRASSLWSVTTHISAKMGLEGDFYGHKASDTIKLEVNQLIERPGVRLTELA
jgi:hypothetical protein